jgi:cell division protein FtsN
LYWLRPVDSVARADLTLPRPQQDAQPFEFVATPGATASVAAADPLRDGADAKEGAPASDRGAAAQDGVQDAVAAQPLPGQQPKPRVTLETQEPVSPAAAPEVRAIATNNARSGAAETAAPAVTAAKPAAAAPAATEKRSVPLAKLAPTAPLHEFWVQVGSFASQSRAAALGQRLSDHGIISRVTTRSKGAEVFFRVRVGPYGSRSEAEKFLAWVQQVDGLDGSYISEVRNAKG